MFEDIDLHFPAHLRELYRRTEAALQAGGSTLSSSTRVAPGRLSGRPALPVRCESTLQALGAPPDAPDCFVAWTSGAARPRLCFHQPADYWHRPPELPGGAWQDPFDISILREPSAARPLLELASRRCAFIGEWQVEFELWGSPPSTRRDAGAPALRARGQDPV